MTDEHLVHRDDLPPELIEELESRFPGMTIACAGDARGPLPDKVADAHKAMELLHEKSIVMGLCVDCGAKMEGYPPDDFEEWQLPKGWRYFTNITDGTPMCFQCPACDAADGEGPQVIDLSRLEERAHE